MSHAPFDGRRVVVTGAAGFIGSHLVDALLAQGCVVIGVDRRQADAGSRAQANLAQAMENPALTLVTSDLATDDVTSLLHGAEVVFHLAAIPGVRSSWGSEFEAYATSNVLGTQRLLTACQAAGVRRFVYASSSSVYGHTSRPSRETDTTSPASPYGVTKLAAEHLALAYARHQDTALSVVALRYFTVYGPRQRPDMAFNRMLSAALTGQAFSLYGTGQQRREFTYVADVVRATIAAADIDVETAVINVGGGSSVTVAETLEIVGEVTDTRLHVIDAPSQPGDVPVTAADLATAELMLGYKPRTALRDGLHTQAEWMRRFEVPMPYSQPGAALSS